MWKLYTMNSNKVCNSVAEFKSLYFAKKYAEMLANVEEIVWRYNADMIQHEDTTTEFGFIILGDDSED